jgi:hypothetical protein
LKDLNLSLARVNKTLRGHITEHQEILLRRLANVSLLFADIKQVKAGVTMLQASTRRIRRDILTPIDDMRAQTARLARIQQASRLLRQATRVLSLTQSLRVEIAKFDGVTVTRAGVIEEREAVGPNGSNRGGATSAGAAGAGAAAAAAAAATATASATLSDLPKAAALLHEIEKIIGAHAKLPSVAMVSEQRPFLKEAGTFVRTRATASLRMAVLNFEQNDASRALQVFFNMQGLPQAVAGLVASLTSGIPNTVMQKLDLRQVAHEAAVMNSRRGGNVSIAAAKTGPSQNLMPPSGQVKLWKRLFWGRFDSVCEDLHQYSLQVWTLQRILSKKRDPVTHVNFLTMVATDPAFQHKGHTSAAADNALNTKAASSAAAVAVSCDPDKVGTVYAAFWNALARDFAGALLSLARKFSFVKNVLVREYPLLRERLEAMLRRLQQSTEARAKLADHTSIGSSKAEHRLLIGKVTAPFLKVYLARSSARLNAAINIMGGAPVVTGRGDRLDKADQTTPKGNRNLSLGLPTSKAMKTFVDCVRDELRAVRHDIGLSVAVTRNVVRSVRSVLTRLRVAWCTHPDCYTFDMLSFRSKNKMIQSAATTDSSGVAHLDRQNRVGGSAGFKNDDWKNGGEGLNSFQIHNCMLAHLLEQMRAGIVSLAAGLDDELRASRTMLERASAWGRHGDISRRGNLLSDVCGAIENLRSAIVGSFWGALAKCLEGIVTSVHLEHYGGSTAGTASGPGRGDRASEDAAPLSTFMQKLGRAVDTLLSAKGFAMLLGPAGGDRRQQAEMGGRERGDGTTLNNTYRCLTACRVTDAFVQHVALVRPLGARGRGVLRADAAALKGIVSKLLALNGQSESQAETATHMFAELDALLEIVLPDSEIPSSGVMSHPRVSDGTLRPSLCFHHILARAPPELQLPHRRQGWSQARYLVCFVCFVLFLCFFVHLCVV